MKFFKVLVIISSIAVFLICLYSFLLGNNVFEGKFSNEAIPWYFLAKGIFCSLSLYVLFLVLVELKKKGEGPR